MAGDFFFGVRSTVGKSERSTAGGDQTSDASTDSPDSLTPSTKPVICPRSFRAVTFTDTFSPLFGGAGTARAPSSALQNVVTTLGSVWSPVPARTTTWSALFRSRMPKNRNNGSGCGSSSTCGQHVAEGVHREPGAVNARLGAVREARRGGVGPHHELVVAEVRALKRRVGRS